MAITVTPAAAERVRNFLEKRGKGVGFAGIENGLFFDAKTRMLFGDAKESLTNLLAVLK